MSLSCVDKNKMIMGNAFILKNNHDRIHIGHDIAKEEREVNKELLQEARKRNNDQSQNFVFKVRSTPWAQKIVEISVQVIIIIIIIIMVIFKCYFSGELIALT